MKVTSMHERKELFNEIFLGDKTGKEHSMKYEKDDEEFATFLRKNYYNVKLSNESVSILKQQYKSCQ